MSRLGIELVRVSDIFIWLAMDVPQAEIKEKNTVLLRYS